MILSLIVFCEESKEYRNNRYFFQAKSNEQWNHFFFFEGGGINNQRSTVIVTFFRDPVEIVCKIFVTFFQGSWRVEKSSLHDLMTPI